MASRTRKDILEEHIKSVVECSNEFEFEGRNKGFKNMDAEGKENVPSNTACLHTAKYTYTDDCVERPSARAEARSARLARLARTINSWEDNLTNQNTSSQELHKESRVKTTASTRVYSVKQNICPSASEFKSGSTSNTKPIVKEVSLKRDAEKSADSVKPKRVMWDSTVITTLESQGFERCESEEHLVYDYKEPKSPANCLKKDSQFTTAIHKRPGSLNDSRSSPSKSSGIKHLRKPVQQEEDEDTQVSIISSPKLSRVESPQKLEKRVVIKLPEQGGKEGQHSLQDEDLSKNFAAAIVKELTPVKVHQRSPSHLAVKSQVLDLAAQYEKSTSPKKKNKEIDPSQLPLSQRKALFEKGGGAVIPRAPLTAAVPQKTLHSSKNVEEPPPKKLLLNSPSVSGAYSEPSVDKLKHIREEREKEMNVLRKRWTENKSRNEEDQEDSSKKNEDDNEKEESRTEEVVVVPCPPPLPSSPEVDTSHQTDDEFEPPLSPPVCPNTAYPGVNDLKRIRISPTKPGRLYPSISDIETETETETDILETDNNSWNRQESSFEESDTSSTNSLGRSIVKLANSTSSLRKRPSDTSDEEARVLGEIDNFLDEALGEDPSPPKKRLLSTDLDEMDDLTNSDSDGHTTEEMASTVPSTSGSQLVHTISLYRKQNLMTIKSTTTLKPQPLNDPMCSESGNKKPEVVMEQKSFLETEQELVHKKIQSLLCEMSKQQAIISQATQALNLCSSTIEFSGSSEQIEAEKLLLIATQRRIALKEEVDRLRIEGTLRSTKCPNPDRGDVTVQNISLPLNMDVIRCAAREEKCYYIVVLMRCGPEVVATEMLPAMPKNLKQLEPFILPFKASLNLRKLHSDFTVTLEVYSLQARSKEILPHDIKYHITPSAKKEKLKLTPKKSGKESRLIKGPLESPGGPTAVRTPSFKMSGFSIFSLKEIKKSSFALNKVSYGSILCGSIQVNICCEMTVDGVEFEGWLTMFRDVSGFGAWHRRWCHLKNNFISYWLYPEHQHTKTPIDSIDLRDCSNDGPVDLVSRDMCARPNTFLLQITRPRQPSDTASLVMNTYHDITEIRHLMSADTKEDRLDWCAKINQCLAMLNAWGRRSPVKHTPL